MASFDVYMNYRIMITDPSEYQAAILAGDGTGFYTKCPAEAAAAFGIPTPYPSGNLETIDKTILFTPPFVPGLNYFFPNDSGITIDDTVNSQLVPGQAGVPASTWPATDDGNFIWSGIIQLKGGQASSGHSFTPMTRRRWATGFEGSLDMLSELRFRSRAASRTVDGEGFYIRRPGSSISYNPSLSLFGTPTDKWKSWERFYFRYRALPTNNVYFWFAKCTASAGANQARIRLNTDGSLSFINYASTVNNVLFSTLAPLVIDQWYKIDIVLECNSASSGGSGRLRVFINGLPVGDATVTTGFGSPSPIFGHVSTRLGVGNETDIGLFASFEADFDDWINCEPLPSLNSMDFLFGTHIIPAYVTEYGSLNSGGWTPALSHGFMNAWKTALATVLGTSNNIVSVTPGAILHGETDFEIREDMLPAFVFGVASLQTCYRVINQDLASGTAGYTANSVPTESTVSDTSANVMQALHTPVDGLTAPVSVEPLGVIKTKSANADSMTINGLMLCVELLGVFGYEDSVEALLPPVGPVMHNSMYPNTQYAIQGGPFAAPVYATGGTYVGTGTQVEFTLPLPVHFLWIRNTSTHQNTHWFATSVGGHKAGLINIFDTIPVRCKYDPDTTLTTVSIAGNDVSLNSLGVTYQYVAFMDVGMRYCTSVPICGLGTAAAATLALFDPTWVPEALMMQRDRWAAGTAGDIYYKSTSAGEAATPLDAGEVANIMSFTTGQINIGTAAMGLLDDTYSFMAWRTDDGSGVMVQICSYTGDGVNPRVINLTPVSGRFPLLAIVKSRSATAAIYRDPSHTSTNSATINGTNTTNGIIAGGVDTITVQSTLNSNGVVYDVFVITGDDSAWNNGSFGPPPGPGTGFPTPGPISSEPNVVGDGGVQLGKADGAAITLLKDIGGIYTLVPGKHEDTLMDRQTGQTEVDMKIPDPTFGTGFVGG